jgi:hypothetical protein
MIGDELVLEAELASDGSCMYLKSPEVWLTWAGEAQTVFKPMPKLACQILVSCCKSHSLIDKETTVGSATSLD